MSDAVREDQKSHLEAFCREHETHVLLLTAHLLGPDSDYRDLAQEVFMVAAQRLKKGETIESPRAWLGSVATKLAANIRRTAKLRACLGLLVERPEMIDWKTPEQLTREKEGRLLLGKMLDKLSEKKRSVYILHEIQGLACPEIAQVLGTNVNTVYARLRHARDEVRRQAIKLGVEV